MRTDPPMSLPWAMQPIPVAVAAPAPPLEPPGVTAGSSGFSVRPCRALSLKMRIEKAAAEGQPHGTNRLAGTVRDIAYYGDFVMYVVALADGSVVRVSRPTETRITELPITWNDPVTVTWPSFATVVLAQ